MRRRPLLPGVSSPLLGCYNEAWSGGGLAKRSRATPKPQTVPVTEVFQRILCDLPPATAATVDEVDAALHQLSLSDNITLVHPTSPTRVTPAPVDGSFVDLYQKARRLSVMEVPATGEQADMLGTGNGATATIDRLPVIPHLGLEGSELAEPHSGSATRVREMNELQRKDYNSAPVGKTLIDCLFVAPTPSLLNHNASPHNDGAPRGDAPTLTAPTPPPRGQRRHRVFDMSTEFLSMFQGPLPHYIVAALTAAFNLEDEGAEELDEALTAIAREAIEDLQVEAVNIQVHAQAATA